MAWVNIPLPLRRYANGERAVVTNAKTVGGALASLRDTYPQLENIILDEHHGFGSIVQLFLNGVHVRDLQGPDTPLRANDTLTIVLAITGGSK
jgi:molybdopterin converting factor small subunit